MESKLVLAGILLLAILASGCASNDSSLKLSTTEVLIEGNKSAEIGFRVHNAGNETASYQARVKPQDTENDYVEIVGNQTVFDLGDAQSQGQTSWEYTRLRGKPENIDAQAVAINLYINASREDSNQTQLNKTVAITVQR